MGVFVGGVLARGGFLQEGGLDGEGGGFAGDGFWLEGGFGRRGIWPDGGFARRGVLSGRGFVLFPLTTTVATPNINCILVSTL